MRLGVVSDTHGHLGNTRRAVERLQDEAVEHVIHCGDIGSPEVVMLFAAWSAHFVFGNCDADWNELTSAIRDANQTSHGEFGTLELAGCRIAVLHGHDHRRFRQAIDSQSFQLVCYGHTHRREHHFEGDTLVLNPGALFRADPHTIAVVDLPSLAVAEIEVG